MFSCRRANRGYGLLSSIVVIAAVVAATSARSAVDMFTTAPVAASLQSSSAGVDAKADAITPLRLAEAYKYELPKAQKSQPQQQAVPKNYTPLYIPQKKYYPKAANPGYRKIPKARSGGGGSYACAACRNVCAASYRRGPGLTVCMRGCWNNYCRR